MKQQNVYYRTTYVDVDTGECWDKAPPEKYKIIDRTIEYRKDGEYWTCKETTVKIQFIKEKQLKLWE